MPCVWGYWVVAHIVGATATGFNSICPNKLNHTREDDEGKGDIKMRQKKTNIPLLQCEILLAQRAD